MDNHSRNLGYWAHNECRRASYPIGAVGSWTRRQHRNYSISDEKPGEGPVRRGFDQIETHVVGQGLAMPSNSAKCPAVILVAYFRDSSCLEGVAEQSGS